MSMFDFLKRGSDTPAQNAKIGTETKPADSSSAEELRSEEAAAAEKDPLQEEPSDPAYTLELLAEEDADTEKESAGEEAANPADAEELPSEETAAVKEELLEEPADGKGAEELPAKETAAVKKELLEEPADGKGAEELPAKETAAVKKELLEKPADGKGAEELPAEETEAAKEEPLQDAAEEESSAADPISALSPSDVFGYFKEISAIPHGSFHTQALSEYIEEFARDHGLPCVRDEMGNLIITRPASAGCEGAAPIALQGHIDMVCEQENPGQIDMDREPISLRTDGEWLWADKTTLGGDDGIAVAIMMALLTDDSIKCPPLECIFTVDEEVGLLGASGLDLSSLRSRRMINLDSEEEGIITAACAGGAEEVCTLAGRRREKKGTAMEIRVDGLRGGHSGEMIGAGRANAVLLLARLLYRLEEKGKYCLTSFSGGTRDNAIPRSSRAEILFTGEISKKRVRDAVTSFTDEIRNEYHDTDPDIRIRIRWGDRKKKGRGLLSEMEAYLVENLEEFLDPKKRVKDRRISFTRSDTKKMVRFLMSLPNGVIEFTPRFREVPRTSLNLGIVQTVADGIRTNSLVRSSVESRKSFVKDRIRCIADSFGASVETRGEYPAWELVENSSFRTMAAEIYRRTTGREAFVRVIHGGLECGILASKIPGLDCISIGPDMEEVHTPAERLNVPSCARTYEYVKAILAACAEKET